MQSTSVIVFASQKGGSGKTTLSGHIAVQAQLSGAGPVAIIDTDPQRSLAQWRYAREDNEIILKVSDVENVERDIAELKELGAATIVIDTPPAATSAIGEVVRHADLVCIPTRPSPHDLRAVGATIDIVESHRRPMIFVLNSAAARAKITSEAAMALSQHGTVAPAIVHNRVDFAASMTDGRTVMEVDEGARSAQEIKTLWDYIATRLDKIAELGGAMAAGIPLNAAAASPQPATADVDAQVQSASAEAVPAEPPSPEPSSPEPSSPELASSEPEPAVSETPPIEPAAPMAAEPASLEPVAPLAAEPAAFEPSAPSAAEAEPAAPIAVEAEPDGELEAEPRAPTRTLTAREFFAQRRAIKTPTYFGPDRRRAEQGAPAGLERRTPTFGRRAN